MGGAALCGKMRTTESLSRFGRDKKHPEEKQTHAGPKWMACFEPNPSIVRPVKNVGFVPSAFGICDRSAFEAMASRFDLDASRANGGLSTSLIGLCAAQPAKNVIAVQAKPSRMAHRQSQGRRPVVLLNRGWQFVDPVGVWAFHDERYVVSGP
jgi:hypothetical protein